MTVPDDVAEEYDSDIFNAGLAPGATSGWKPTGMLMRILYPSEYRGASFSVGGAILSHSFELASGLWPCAPAGRYAHTDAVLTRSGEYMRTLRRTLMTRTVRAPRRGCGFLWSIAGSIAG